MILANGTAVTVSNSSNPDLFWAIRGAGHNFGIVTEFTLQIYDVQPNATWAYEQFIFGSDKIEEVYEQINIMQNQGEPPVELINYSLALRLPDVDPVNVGLRSDFQSVKESSDSSNSQSSSSSSCMRGHWKRNSHTVPRFMSLDHCQSSRA